MNLLKLSLHNFRLFSELEVNFTDGINVICGLNGQGKTTILEAIHFLSVTKSFKTNQDKIVIKDKENLFEVRGSFKFLENKIDTIRVFYSEGTGKKVFIGDKSFSKLSEFIGKIPTVTLSLDNLNLIHDGPSERRRFLDFLLSQTSALYLDDLRNYRKIVNQRNTLYSNANELEIRRQIPLWNEQLVEFGARIILKRIEFISYLNEHLNEYYNKFSGSKEKIKAEYESNVNTEINNCSEGELRTAYLRKLKNIFSYELDKKITLIGPHRDDVKFYKNNHLFSDFGSQGENKTLVIALKFLEWSYSFSRHHIKPILLLDDIFGELDLNRMQRLMEFLSTAEQTIITTTLSEKFDVSLTKKKIRLDQGMVYYA